jgi:DNA polymerase-3 subunit gamma/tau
VLEEVKGKRRFTWILLSQNCPGSRDPQALAVAHVQCGARDSFAAVAARCAARGMVVVMGRDFAVETMVDPSARIGRCTRTPAHRRSGRRRIRP